MAGLIAFGFCLVLAVGLASWSRQPEGRPVRWLFVDFLLRLTAVVALLYVFVGLMNGATA